MGAVHFRTQSLLRTLTEIDPYDRSRRQALQLYLRKSIENRIRDDTLDYARPAAIMNRYRAAMARLGPGERALIVASVELGYTYEQVALAESYKSPDAARAAIRRALLHLAEEMSCG